MLSLYAKEWLCSKRNWYPFRSEISLDLMVLLPFQDHSQLQLLTRCSFKKAGVENMRKRGAQFGEGKGPLKERYRCPFWVCEKSSMEDDR